jgi:predicted helicase
VGIVTARDEFVIDFDKKRLENRIAQLSNKTQDDQVIAQAFNLNDKSNWKLSDARKQIKELDDLESNIYPIQYRPFDIRYIFYHESLVERSRRDVMRHMLENNLGINMVRQVKTGDTWQHCLISNTISESCYISNKTSEIGYVFPVYLYKEKTPKKAHIQSIMIFEPEADYGDKDRVPNIDKAFYEKLNKAYKRKLTPEEILYYVYAVLYSNAYREKYAEFLKIDFPRLPFTSDHKLFQQLAKLGNQLVDLHLMKSEYLNKPVTKYEGGGDNDKNEKVSYSEKEHRIYINKNKYFDNITSELWNYQIGGYQVLQKYLKDRKDRAMDDPRHYCRIVTAIAKTIDLQDQIDEIYNEVEKEIIKI